MATKEKHVEKADRNASFAKSLPLDNQANIDWAVTALFYSGLHYVEAYLEKNGTSAHLHDTHGKRDRLMVMDSTLKRVQREYTDLKNFSLMARYECSTMTSTEVTDEAIPALEAIKKAIQKVI